MGKPKEAKPPNLAQMELEWALLLFLCLKECAAGRSGLFANSPVVSAFVDWPEAERLRALTHKITQAHAAMGSVHLGCRKFLTYCSLRGNDFRREPGLATEYLRELGYIEST